MCTCMNITLQDRHNCELTTGKGPIYVAVGETFNQKTTKKQICLVWILDINKNI